MTIKSNDDAALKEHVFNLAKAYGNQFVRKDNKFFDIEHLDAALSRTDVEQMIINRSHEEFPEVPKGNELYRALFKMLIETRHTDRERSFQVWNGSSIFLPGERERLVTARGAVTPNVWVEPHYRSLRVNSTDLGPISDFLDVVFKSKAERDLFVNWLAWSLQNERDKPTWAPFFYSRSKGTGKSTLCRLMSEVFGVENTAVQNNLDKLTQQFNSTVLRSKLVISEETHLQQGSSKGNAIKTFITDRYVLVEQKGKEAVRAQNYTCFAFTSNFFPNWIEEGERRYAIFDIDHDGCAGGARVAEFSELVGEVHAFLDAPERVARLYNALMHHQVPESFSAKHLTPDVLDLPAMKRLQQASRQTTIDELEEVLNELGALVVPQSDIVTLLRKHVQSTTNQTRHMMDELGWTKVKAKWGGKDYARALWVKPGYTVDGGKIFGPSENGVRLTEYLQKHAFDADVEYI